MVDGMIIEKVWFKIVVNRGGFVRKSLGNIRIL